MRNPVRLAVIMDPITGINPAKDSTLAMLLAAQARQWQIHYGQLHDIWLRDGEARGRLTSLKVTDDQTCWYEFGKVAEQSLGDMDVILMRKDPPFDIGYVHSTYILERAESQGALVINRPQSLRDANEKVFTAWFPQCCPPTLISRSMDDLRRFIDECRKAVVKPLDTMGGWSVFITHPEDGNRNVMLEVLTNNGSKYVIAQEYVPDVVMSGDKRILLIDGEPIPFALARVPFNGDHRGNLASGAKAQGRPLTPRDRWICEQVGPVLRQKGLFFVGIDVIGDFLTEINVTSPTCIRELDRAHGLAIGETLMDAIESKLSQQNERFSSSSS